MRGLALSLVTHERIITTAARAKATRAMVERLITTGKANDLHHRRLLLKSLPNAKAVEKIINKISPRYKDRNGGYTRMIKMDRRQGDGAEQVLVEFITE